MVVFRMKCIHKAESNFGVHIPSFSRRISKIQDSHFEIQELSRGAKNKTYK